MKRNLIEQMIKHFRRVFSLNLKSLAVFRIFLGVVLIYDFVQRLLEVEVFYSSTGLFPLRLISNYAQSIPWHTKLFFISDNVMWSASIMAVILALSLLFTLGAWTKQVTPLLWILVASTSMRAPTLDHLGDTILIGTLFWSMFLPLDCFYSVRPQKSEVANRNYFSLASAAFVIQILLFYFCNGAKKIQFGWLDTNTVQTSLMNLRMTTEIGKVILHFPAVLKFLSLLTVSAECLFPIFILIDRPRGILRPLSILAIALLHSGIFALMNLDFISIIAIVALIPLFDLHAGTESDSTTDISSAVEIRKPHAFAKLFLRFACVYLCLSFVVKILQEYVPALESASFQLKNFSMISLQWEAFVPPPTTQGWSWIVLNRKDGTKRYFMPGCQLTDDVESTAPEQIPVCYKNIRWYKYIINFNMPIHPELEEFSLGLANYFCHFDNNSIQKIELWNRFGNIRDGQIGRMSNARIASVACP